MKLNFNRSFQAEESAIGRANLFITDIKLASGEKRQARDFELSSSQDMQLASEKAARAPM